MSTNRENRAPKGATLSETELQDLSQWKPRFFELPVHARIAHQMHCAMRGIESSVLIGRPGTGKTHALQELANRIDDAEIQRSMEDALYVPRRILVYETSNARGRMTALIDLMETLTGPLSVSARRSYNPKRLVEDIGWELKGRAIHLVCVDEAQKIDADNLDQLRQVIDACARIEHPFGLLLAGSEEIRETLVRIQQLGQRFSTEIHLPLITPSGIGPHLAGFHPHLGPLKAALKKSEWNALERDLFQAVGGKFRRLRIILANANEFALKVRRPIDEQMVRAAIAKLVAEV